jgi:hypothetical protein
MVFFLSSYRLNLREPMLAHSIPAHKPHSYRSKFTRQPVRDRRTARLFDKTQSPVQIVRTPIAHQHVQYNLPIGPVVHQTRPQYTGK